MRVLNICTLEAGELCTSFELVKLPRTLPSEDFIDLQGQQRHFTEVRHVLDVDVEQKACVARKGLRLPADIPTGKV